MKFFKYIFISVFVLNLYSSEIKELKPTYFLKASGAVTNLVLKENLLIAGTTASSVDIFDIEKKELVKKIDIKKIKDFTNEKIDSKVYSVDIIDNKILILSQGKSGGRDIFIYENEKLENIISSENRLFIAYAKFLDSENIIYALLSNQIFIYNIKEKKIKNELQISQSSFSHFVLNKDKSSIFVADESGIISLVDIKSFKKTKNFKGQNVDRVFQVDVKKDLLLTAGQDRRVAVYSFGFSKPYYINSDFLVYSAALSPSSKLAAFCFDEQNSVAIFDTQTKEILYKLDENKALLTNILFLNEDEIFVASDDENINFYNLKEN
ncbi:WD40 repeat domain-containing protein [Arcobacter vandammei]|uniref:WD40 repeat domain-containing protein n=1 Tax=Arcobacter vandammei TaxID=2782243 RepID=UPI0018DF8D26|nr:WD40 repeat domain-containing protein [Arcobacter vandammei]